MRDEPMDRTFDTPLSFYTALRGYSG